MRGRGWRGEARERGERGKGWEGEGKRDTHAKPGRATRAGLRVRLREASPISAEANRRVSTSLSTLPTEEGYERYINDQILRREVLRDVTSRRGEGRRGRAPIREINTGRRGRLRDRRWYVRALC